MHLRLRHTLNASTRPNLRPIFSSIAESIPSRFSAASASSIPLSRSDDQSYISAPISSSSSLLQGPFSSSSNSSSRINSLSSSSPFARISVSFAKKMKHARFFSTSSSATGELSEQNIKTPFPDHAYQTDEKVEKYRRFIEPAGDDVDKRTFAYLIASGFRFTAAAGARLAVLQFIATMSPSRSVMALASIEVDISSIPEGKTVTLKWRGKPVFIRHRTAQEIAKERAIDVGSLRDPQSDEERLKDPSRPEYFVGLGVCTHLGCVPLTDAGEVEGGFFCPCHGSHYDTAGRIRKGPAPKNLEVPQHRFLNDKTILIG